MIKTQRHRSPKAALRRCDDPIARLRREEVVPFSFSLDELLVRFQSWRGLHIRLEPVNVGQPSADLPCGVLVSTTTTDYVYHLAGATPLHREHIIVHEITHMLFEHQGGVSAAALAPVLFPDLDPRLLQQILCRAAYTTEEELEAEIFATLFLQQTNRSAPSASHARPDSSDVLDRVEQTWGRSHRRAR